jgi:hypothetical protein
MPKELQIDWLAAAADRLLCTYAGQFEAYRRLRDGGDQYVRVEHVHVNEGGQAIVGNVRTQGGRRAQSTRSQLVGDDPEEGLS